MRGQQMRSIQSSGRGTTGPARNRQYAIVLFSSVTQRQCDSDFPFPLEKNGRNESGLEAGITIRDRRKKAAGVESRSPCEMTRWKKLQNWKTNTKILIRRNSTRLNWK